MRELIALPIVPDFVREEVEAAKRHYAAKERCVFCDIIRQERQEGGRLIADEGRFVALAPFAPRFPFETWILPAVHRSRYEETPAAEFEGLAAVVVNDGPDAWADVVRVRRLRFDGTVVGEQTLPFEVAAVILTVAVIAAVMLTLRRRGGTKHQDPSAQSRVKAADRVRIIRMDAEKPAPPAQEGEAAP